MRQSTHAALAALTAMASAASITDLCTLSNLEAALPANGTLLGIELLPSASTVSVVYNASAGMGSSGTYTYCNATVTYTHPGKDDTVVVKYAFPAPDQYENRFYVAGGGGYSLSSSATGGLSYGAAGGATSAGYDAFDYSFDDVVLKGNGSINWDATYMFAYQALGEMTTLAKYIIPNFYGDSNGTKVYTYFEGCSDGGREAMSQVQRYGDIYDGVVAGAPAFRMAQQQVNHVFPSAVEYVQDYYPPPCALAKIVNATIAACDPLDGRKDGVISRTDLCEVNFNLSSIIGESYYCAEATSSSLGFGISGGSSSSSSNSTSGGPPSSSGGPPSAKVRRQSAEGSTTSTTPAQNGTITAADVAVAQAIYSGLHNSAGQRAYLAWQIGSELSDAETTYDNSTGTWGIDIPSTGGEWVTKFVEELDLDNLSNLDGVTYDTIVEWMTIGFYRYYDSLQTTLPDLTTFKQSGGKLLHYHGESDPSIPAASSVHYFQAVQNAMYANLSSAASAKDMHSWYQFYLVPGAAHCGTNSLQPGPYPEDNMKIIIDWVENGIQPTRLNATVASGTYEGETQLLCQWPTRPLWKSNSTFDCVNDKASIESWTYKFNAFKVPVY